MAHLPQLTEYRLIGPRTRTARRGPSRRAGPGPVARGRDRRPRRRNRPLYVHIAPPSRHHRHRNLISIKASGYMLIIEWQQRRCAFDGERTAGNSPRRKGKDFRMACYYNGKKYSVGSSVCQNGSEYVCYETGWEATGSACSAADGEVIRESATQRPGKEGVAVVGESKVNGPGKVG